MTDSASGVPPVRAPARGLLWGSAALSGLMLLLPAYFLAWEWPGVPLGATCDQVHQAFCRPGYGLPQWCAVAVLCVASCTLHAVAILRWPRSGAGRLSASGLLAAAAAVALVTLARPLLSGVLPDGWFS